MKKVEFLAQWKDANKNIPCIRWQQEATLR